MFASIWNYKQILQNVYWKLYKLLLFTNVGFETFESFCRNCPSLQLARNKSCCFVLQYNTETLVLVLQYHFGKQAILKQYQTNLSEQSAWTAEKARGVDLERAALWKWNPIIAADIMGYGTSDQHSSSSSSLQVSKSHTDTVESLKNSPMDRMEMHEDSSMVQVLLHTNVQVPHQPDAVRVNQQHGGEREEHPCRHGEVAWGQQFNLELGEG